MSNFIQFAEGILVHSENFLKRFEREPQPSFNAPVEAAPETTQSDTPSQEEAPVDPAPEAVAPAADPEKTEEAPKDETKE